MNQVESLKKVINSNGKDNFFLLPVSEGKLSTLYPFPILNQSVVPCPDLTVAS